MPVLTEALRLHHADSLEEALALYLWLDARHPDSADLKFNIGACHYRRRHLSQAVRNLRAALELNPRLASALELLGEVLREQERLPEAEAIFRTLLSLDADNLMAMWQLASVLKAQGRFDDAIVVIRQSLSIKPDAPQALLLLGTLHYEKGEIDAAVGLFRQSLALTAEQPQAHFNLSQCLLLQGHFKEGWEEHEWRGGTNAQQALERGFQAPPWRGEPLTGKTILLHAEQGLGDTLQFIRYVPLLKASGAKVVVECQPLLLRLLEAMPGIDALVAHGLPLPRFDYYAPLMGLPFLFGTNVSSIPAPAAYLHAPATDCVELVELDDRRPKIGLCWAGNPGHSNDANRSIRLGMFETLVRSLRDRVQFVSLQAGPRGTERNSYLWADTMIDAGARVIDFADTACVLEQLDLVISVDTSVLHLAGAMGRPVWGLLPFVPDSRWLMHREDSPWYPSMRLYRQPALGDWKSVMDTLADALAYWLDTAERATSAALENGNH